MNEPKYQVYTTNTSVTIKQRGIKGALEFGVGGPIAAETVAELAEEINNLEVELELRRVALADKIDECAAKDEALRKIAKMDAPTFGEAFGKCVDVARAALSTPAKHPGQGRSHE